MRESLAELERANEELREEAARLENAAREHERSEEALQAEAKRLGAEVEFARGEKLA